MLKCFSVKNFKQFESLTMDFSDVRDYEFCRDCLATVHGESLIKTAIVYGYNASGKSNLGFALFDLVYHLVDRVKQVDAYDYYLNANHPNEFAEFSYQFLFDKDVVTYSYAKQTATKLIREKLVVNGDEVFSWDMAENKQNFEGLKKFDLANLNFVFRDAQLSLLRYIANNAALAPKSPIRQLVKFVGSMLWFRRVDKNNNFMGLQPTITNIDEFIIQNNLVGEFEAFLQKNQVNEKLTVKKAPDGRDGLYFEHKSLLPFFSVASSGTIALAVYFYWLHFVKDVSFLFMDEFDAFYHFAIAESILKQTKEFKCQSVLTTHNTGLLNHKFIRPDVCFIMNNGILKSFPNLTDRELRQGNNLEKLFVAGEFNG